MSVASTETELSLLRALQAGAMWTGARVRSHGMAALATCPYCGGAPETEVHLLWDCPHWSAQRSARLPLVQAEAAQLPALAVPTAWPVCLRATGLLPAALVRQDEEDQAGRLMYRLYGMYLAVLAARMGEEVAARRDAGAGPSVFAVARRRPPDARRGYPWGQLGAGPHLPAPPAVLLALRAGPPPGWPWEASFAEALLLQASQLRWLPGQGHVTYVELAVDLEAHAERALSAHSDHKLRAVTLPLRARGQVLKRALDALQPHVQAGELLQGKEVWMAKSLLPLGGHCCVGRTARPLFACPASMQFQMRQLEAHCRERWTRRLARPGTGRQEVFVLDYFRPAGPGQRPLRPFERLPRRQVQRGRQGAGNGEAGPAEGPRRATLCAKHRAPPCAVCRQRGAEHCCQRAHEGHRMDAGQAQAAARVMRAWLQPAPVQCRPVQVASEAVPRPEEWERQRARKRQRSPPTPPVRATRSARPAVRESTRRPAERSLSLPPPPSDSKGGAHSLSGSGMLNSQGGLRRPARGLADIFGDISHLMTEARRGGAESGAGVGRQRGCRSPPRGWHGRGATRASPPPLGGPSGRGHGAGCRAGAPGPARGGAAGLTPGGVQEGTSDPPSLPPVEDAGGDMAVDPPSGAPHQQPGGPPPPSPMRPSARRAGGKRAGQPRHPMQTLCDDHGAPACKSCKGHRGVRHCCSRHHVGHPRLVVGGGQQRLPLHCVPAREGGLQLQPVVRASAGTAASEPPPPSGSPEDSPAGLGLAAPAPGDTSGPAQGHGRASEEGT